MIYYVSQKQKGKEFGTKDAPFRTITAAARKAMPGDTVIVGPGIYRECVSPTHGGLNNRSRITFRSEVPRGAVITGADLIKGWEHVRDSVWRKTIPNIYFYDDYNPYTTVLEGDWYQSEKPRHTGEVYINGRSMYEVNALSELLDPPINKNSWDPWNTGYTWFTQQREGLTVIYANFNEYDPNKECVEINIRRNCFMPAKPGINYITVSGFVIKQAATTWAPPTAYQDGMIGPHWSKGWIIEDCEISDSKCCGISLGKPFQYGDENKWTRHLLKDGTQTQREVICRALNEGWKKEKVGSHIIRNCEIHDCNQAGIIGHMGGAFSLIENNHIHHINNKQDLAGAEIGGIKMHAALDCVFRNNHIHHCTRGIWLDWQAQGTRVTRNLFHHNMLPEKVEPINQLAIGEDLFIEVSHGPTLVDNNLMLSSMAARISAQGIAFVHNLVGGSLTWVGEGCDNGGHIYATPRYTPYHVPHQTDLAGFMTILHGDVRFVNNVFVQLPVNEELKQYAKNENLYDLHHMNFLCGTKPYDGYPTEEEYLAQFTPESIRDWDNKDIYYGKLPVTYAGNMYFNGAVPSDRDMNCVVDKSHKIHLKINEKDGNPVLKTNLFQFLKGQKGVPVSTETLGQAFEPEQRFEATDGESIKFTKDFFGRIRGLNFPPGPVMI